MKSNLFLLGPAGAMAVMAALVPSGAVVGARLLWPATGPAVAQAASASDATPHVLTFDAATSTPTDEAALRAVRQAMETKLGSTPFPAPTPLAIKNVKAAEPQTPQAKLAGEFAVTSILRGQQPVAIVNGKVCRVGGKVASKTGETWVVVAIDAGEGKVEIENAALGSLTLRLASQGQ
ncbi:MAG: hypothetical protein SFY96_00780 [Planctomycetota bacterium]|nr:hypothetical protein [Planctomycetota bacterium]